MNIKTLFRRMRSHPAPKTARDWSSQFTPREWADLPVHHPRGDDSAV